jgi:hypothetical protein
LARKGGRIEQHSSARQCDRSPVENQMGPCSAGRMRCATSTRLAPDPQLSVAMKDCQASSSRPFRSADPRRHRVKQVCRRPIPNAEHDLFFPWPCAVRWDATDQALFRSRLVPTPATYSTVVSRLSTAPRSEPSSWRRTPAEHQQLLHVLVRRIVGWIAPRRRGPDDGTRT